MLKRFMYFVIVFVMFKFDFSVVYVFVKEKDVGCGVMKFYGFNIVIYNV